MQCIKTIIKHMDNTLAEANEYYTDYCMYRTEAPKLSTTALDMARTHLDLYMKWHAVVVSMINDYKSKEAVPIEMKAIWNYEHEKLTEEYDQLKYKINNVS